MAAITRRLQWRAAAVVLAGALIASAAPAHAQDDDLLPIPEDYFDDGLLPVESDEPPDPITPVPPPDGEQPPIPDGQYVGGWGLGGSWWLSATGLTIIWTGQAAGPIEFEVTEGSLDGTWSMDGGAIVETRGLPVTTTATNQWTSVGTISGGGPYTATGSGTGTATATVDVPGLGPQTRTDSYTFPANGQLDHLIVVCGQVNGSWQQRFDDAFEGTGIQHSVTTYLTAIRTDGDAIDTEVADLNALVAEANVVQVDFGNPGPSLDRLTDIVGRAEDLVAELGFNFTSCDPGEEFMRLITLRVQDVINSYLANWVGQDPPIDILRLQRVITLGLRSGAMGGGGPDPARSLFLQLQAEDLVTREFERAITADGMVEEFANIIVTAEMLGLDLLPAVTLEEACLGLGLDGTAC